MEERFEADPAEATQVAISMGISNMNGIFALAGAMAGRGLLSKADAQMLHDYMLKPMSNDGGNAEMMALHTRRLDDLCAILVMAIGKLERGSGT